MIRPAILRTFCFSIALVAAGLATRQLPAADAAPANATPPTTAESKPVPITSITKDTVFTLKKTTMSPQAIIWQRNVTNADDLLAGKPVKLAPQKSSAELIVDFNRELVGTIQLTVKGDATSRLEVYYGEALQEARKDNEYTTRWYKRPKDFFKVNVGTQTLVNHGRRAFRYMRIVVPVGAAPVTVEHLQATSQHYPVIEAGSFACSDPQLNKIWEISALTTKLCMQQWYEDGVKRDGLLWVSDYRIEYLCNSLLYGDAALSRKCLLLLAAAQFPEGAIPAQASRAGVQQHPSNIEYMPGIPRGVHNWTLMNYCADYVGCVRDYYRYTGDRDGLTKLWPAVRKLTTFLMKQEPGKMKPLAQFITDARHKETWWGSHGTLEMQFVIAMQDAAYLAQVMNDDELRKSCDDYIAAHRKRIEATYFDKDLGFYLDEPGGRQSTSWHVNAFSALCGLSDYVHPAEKLSASKIKVRPATAGFMLYWTLKAKFDAHQATAALDDMRKIWGHMLKYNATTTWEKCDLTVGDHPNEDDVADSRCHGWSAGPANLLPAYVLGVQPKEPGFATVQIEPQLGDLQWAEGTVPTPHGPIHVRWDAGKHITGMITLPAGVTGEATIAGKTIALKPGANVVGGG